MERAPFLLRCRGSAHCTIREGCSCPELLPEQHHELLNGEDRLALSAVVADHDGDLGQRSVAEAEARGRVDARDLDVIVPSQHCRVVIIMSIRRLVAHAARHGGEDLVDGHAGAGAEQEPLAGRLLTICRSIAVGARFARSAILALPTVPTRAGRPLLDQANNKLR